MHLCLEHLHVCLQRGFLVSQACGQASTARHLVNRLLQSCYVIRIRTVLTRLSARREALQLLHFHGQRSQLQLCDCQSLRMPGDNASLELLDELRSHLCLCFHIDGQLLINLGHPRSMSTGKCLSDVDLDLGHFTNRLLWQRRQRCLRISAWQLKLMLLWHTLLWTGLNRILADAVRHAFQTCQTLQTRHAVDLRAGLQDFDSSFQVEQSSLE
mmetsp:Transcript_19937/g.37542  ORF Transcript_19937/g.37542 Transcript_19937/m.37542 type:complete len:213 (-) Transcript_19937:207-845(-)